MFGFRMLTFGDVITIVVVVLISGAIADTFQWSEWLVAALVMVVAIVAKQYWFDFKKGKHYREQTEHRRRIIRGLCDQDDSLDHVALVLSHSDFKDEDGKDIKPDQIRAEYDAILVLDEIESRQEA